MPASAPSLVWYASYGSNCSRPRFLTYLRGGRPPGSDWEQLGARDPSDPLDDGPVEFAQSVCFAGHSPRWGGAPAFLEHRTATGAGALGRRYLITREQFADVLAQESRRPIGSLDLPDLDALTAGDRTVVGDSFYDALVILDPVDGVPCVSFTSPAAPEQREPTAPSEPYLRTIVTGLADIHPLDATTIARRICDAPGVAPTWDLESVLELIHRGEPR